ncbi:MAG: tyrosine-type recombinase/integrase [Aphanocapsa sp. GSE-SYN-MK-11-07L]|jgi:integrase/recombinase XerD|nr:tyrosine-type recombinase/integrase [Aphanocapsa sp. GSE-SYN-MK-11-07L]
MTIPAVKLISIAPAVTQTPAAQLLGERRSLREEQSSPSAPADLRWSRVEEYLRSRELRPNTRKAYEREFKAFLDWTEKGWQDMTARDIDRYKSHLKLKPSHRGGERKAATINLALSALQSLFKWLCARDYIVKDPMLLVEKLKSDPVLPQEWEQTEVTALFEATRQRGQTELRDRAILWLLLHGLRAREAEALNVGDFDGQRVTIREAKDDSVGQVPLLPEAVETLERYLNWRRCGGEALEDGSPLFLSESNNSKGQRLSYWGIYTIVKELAAIAGVKDSHPHRGRHTVATEMVSRGIDPLLAMQITRHKSPKSFERYSQRALQKQAEEQFLQVFSERRPGEPEPSALPSVKESPLPLEQLLAEGQNLPETLSSPLTAEEIQMAEPLLAIRQSSAQLEAKVNLWLRVENNSPLVRGKTKVRREIEHRILSRFQMHKPMKTGWDYELSIPYADEADLERTIAELGWEMEFAADLDQCFIEAQIREEATGRRA